MVKDIYKVDEMVRPSVRVRIYDLDDLDDLNDLDETSPGKIPT